MDLYMILLRLVHIVAGILWVGFAIFMLFFTAPTVRRLEAAGTRFMYLLYTHTPIQLVMPVLALLTTGAGILLYLRASDTFNADWIGSPGGLVLTIGSLAGILAFGHGVAALIPLNVRYRAAVEKLQAQEGPPSAEQVAELQALGAKLGLNSRIGAVLMAIAVIGMASARYF